MNARLLTAAAPGAVAVVEVRGTQARTQVEDLCPSLHGAKLGAVRLARLTLDGEQLDEALVWLDSETRVEIHLHGSPVLVRRLLSRLGGPSSPDEGNTIEDRATRLLASAASEAAARILLDQTTGALRRELEAVLGTAAGALARLEELEAAGERTRLCLEPLRVALVGPVNAGKSTLFNALVGARRAIVSSQAGATRDVLVASARLGAWPIEVFDTAGERGVAAVGDARGELERAGQRLAQRARADADWVLRLWPADGGAPDVSRERDGPREAWIESRADLAPAGGWRSDARLAAGPDPHGAVSTLTALFRATFALPAEPWRPGTPAPFDERSRELVRSARRSLEANSADWRSPLRSLLGD